MNFPRFTSLLLLASALPGVAADHDQRVAEFFSTANIVMPSGVNPQVGALTVLRDGRIAVCFHHGQVEIFDPKAQGWQHFAEGLHEPLGILQDEDDTLLVMQRAELTRLRDTDKDGVADEYQKVWDDFGMSGNYHEFAFGPARGADGKLYIALNLASNGASVREEIRGPWTDIGVPRQDFYKRWDQVSGEAGRMYSRVAWRGWVMKLDPKTGVAEPYACGFRSPDGIGFDAQGRLLVSDNEGDWRGTSELHCVKPDGFYGHPGSLVWRKDWDGSQPLKTPVPQLERMRTRPAVWFPHNIYANSPTQPVVIPKTPAWGPFGGQTLIGEMNVPRLLRLLIEETDGVSQGACIPFIETNAIKAGLHRMVFAGDTLWVGRTHLSWAGAEGISTITPVGKVPFDPLDIHITPTGFRIEFTRPIDPKASKVKASRYTYAYHIVYGSPQLEKAEVPVSKLTFSKDNTVAEVDFGGLKENFVYDLDLSQIKAADGTELLNPRLAYTVRKVPSAK